MSVETKHDGPCVHHRHVAPGFADSVSDKAPASGPSCAISEPRQRLEFTINGRLVSLNVVAGARLLDVIRDELLLTGVKEGCGIGECGACTVILEDKAILSCMTPALSVQGLHVTTIEGVAEGEKLHPVQAAIIKHAALQCGFCTPAMVLVAVNLLKNRPDADRETIRQAMSGTLCRCTGYEQILDAVEEARDVLRAVRS